MGNLETYKTKYLTGLQRSISDIPNITRASSKDIVITEVTSKTYNRETIKKVSSPRKIKVPKNKKLKVK